MFHPLSTAVLYEATRRDELRRARDTARVDAGRPAPARDTCACCDNRRLAERLRLAFRVIVGRGCARCDEAA